MAKNEPILTLEQIKIGEKFILARDVDPTLRTLDWRHEVEVMVKNSISYLKSKSGAYPVTIISSGQQFELHGDTKIFLIKM